MTTAIQSATQAPLQPKTEAQKTSPWKTVQPLGKTDQSSNWKDTLIITGQALAILSALAGVITLTVYYSDTVLPILTSVLHQVTACHRYSRFCNTPNCSRLFKPFITNLDVWRCARCAASVV